MSDDINLLPNKRKDKKYHEKTLIILRRLSYFSLAIVCFISIVLFIFTKTSSVGPLESKRISITANISRISTKTSKYAFVDQRLKDISIIIATRSNFQKTLDTIMKAAPEGVILNSFSISKKGVIVSASSGSLIPISAFLNNLVDLASKKQFSKITLDNLTLEPKTNSYVLSVTLLSK